MPAFHSNSSRSPRGAGLFGAAAVTLGLLAAGPATAAIYYVSPCGNDAFAGFSTDCGAAIGPKRTIQAAIDVASDGDLILVQPGVYPGGLDTDGKAIIIQGVAGPAATIVDANGAGRGMSVNSLEGDDTIIQGLTFREGVAEDGAGVLISLATPRFIDCIFEQNAATDDGGAIAVVGASPTFESCIFRWNTADDRGGAVDASVGGIVTFDDCTFFQNASATGGGLAASSVAVEMELTAFTDNFATTSYGGGIRLDGGSLTATDSAMSINEGKDFGGGLYAANAEVSLTSTTVANNVVENVTGQRSGGGIAMNGGSLLLVGSNVAENDATYGGGLHLIETPVTMTDALITGNTANGGAGMWVSNAGEVVLEDTTFSVNIAEVNGPLTGSSGGGIRAHNVALTIDGGSFLGNTTEGRGGAIRAMNAVAHMDGVTFDSNFALDRGGAVVLEHANEEISTISDCVFACNDADTLAGGLLIYSSRVAVTACTFSANTAHRAGALLVGGTSGYLTVARDCLFSGNEAWGSIGGAIIQQSNDPLWLIGGDVLFNSAAHGGGGIAIDGTDLNVIGTRIAGNSAPYGGGIYSGVPFGTALVTNALLLQNEAFITGGHGYAETGGGIRFVNTTMAFGTAPGGAGALAADFESRIDVRNSIVWGNGIVEVDGGSSIDARYSLMPESVSGVGVIHGDPAFTNFAAGDYTLLPESPAIDAGLNWFLADDTPDLDGDGDTLELLPIDRGGNPRIQINGGEDCGLGRVDMGAYEADGAIAPIPYTADLDANGVVDFMDLLMLLAAWGDPEACVQTDLDGDGIVAFGDLLILLAHWTS